MPKVSDLLNPRCPECQRHEIWDQGLCWFCCQEKGLLPPPREQTEREKAMWSRIAGIARHDERNWERRPYYRSEGAEYYDTDGVMDDE